MNDNLPPESADDLDPEIEASISSISQMDPLLEASSLSISQMDPLLEALLEFTPAPRKYKRANAWTPALQRQFIALLAETGSPARASEAMGKDRYGIEKVYKSEGAESFRGAWDAAIALFEERDAARQAAERRQWIGVRPPAGVDHRSPGPAPSRRRAEPAPEEDYFSDQNHQDYSEAQSRIRDRLTHARRLLLCAISDDEAQRNAWEVLVGPVDWDKAERLEAQADEPFGEREWSMRKADMLLTAEAGLLPDLTGGPDALEPGGDA